ncbi:MAG TPA: leucine--tRNA ligase [Candidatus Thermoplasmatota archaeon]|nr:leucine--tRNA ligase [Candidatus Thermoplasmatota archaeon]
MLPDEDLAAIEQRWMQRYREARVDEPRVEPGRPKFFATYPYSYMNAFPHVGHAYTMSRVDFMVRFQRQLGRNTLFPFAYHITGTPIQAAANRIRDGEPKMLKIMADQGIPAADVPKFAEPRTWAEFFPKEWRKDVQRLGLAIDWRREFVTTDANPHYDAFIRWQYRKLYEKGYVAKGNHPVVWCPKDSQPIADHDRTEGEGATPQEWTLVKLKLRDPDARRLGLHTPAFLVAATLRPETMYGQTNVWVEPELVYQALDVAGESWVVSPSAAVKIPLQQKDVVQEPVQVLGRRLLGLMVHAPAREAEIPVLPLEGKLIQPDKGTGIVTSVPSDAPVDFAGLRFLQAHPEVVREHRLDEKMILKLQPIPIIATPGFGPAPARDVVEKMGIRGPSEKEKLDAATEEVYKAGFYAGTMLVGAFQGRAVQEAKERIKAELLARGAAARFWEPSERVVCRCLTAGVVKMVSDQWFVRYSDEAWKARAHQAVDQLTAYPAEAKKQFHYVLDWLRDWACARGTGLGTKLPWDPKWVIESLSDSTIYMAYYALVPHLLDVDAKDLSDAAFDVVLLGQGSTQGAAKGTLTSAKLDAMRAEFLYWYPMDFRNSGKDLVQNHLMFMVFHHAALFPKEHWPRGISVNGWVMVDGAKMSKSAGNFVTLRQALDHHGASAVRLALANAGEGLDDANFEQEFAAQAPRKLKAWLASLREAPPLRAAPDDADASFRSTLARLVLEARGAYERAEFRTALKVAFFDLPREWQWYLRRAGGSAHEDVWTRYRRVAIRLMVPLVPHVAEEAWHAAGGQGLAIDAGFPEARPDEVDPIAEQREDFLRGTLQDAREILKVTGIKAQRIVLYAAPAWKREALEVAAEVAKQGKLDVGGFLKAANARASLKPHAKELPKLAQGLLKDLGSLRPEQLAQRAALDERAALEGARTFLSVELGAPVEVVAADAPGVEDPADKAKFAAPGRPAIWVA